MASVEEGEAAAAEEVPFGNPDEIAKNPEALKEAHEEMATLDVLVCGQCHSAFHYVEEFQQHKEGGNCSGKSPVRDNNESKAQVWAFLLWKCSSARDGSVVNSENSWKLYQQWCRMPEPQRTAWITAGASVQNLSKFAHAKVMEMKTDDQLVPVQTPDKKPRGRPRKTPKLDDSDAQPSGEESDTHLKVSPAQKVVAHKVPAQNAKKLKDLLERDNVRLAQERVPPEERIARRTDREGGDPATINELKDLLERDNVRLAQERVPPEERIARRTDREGGDPSQSGEFVVEKILAKRFNPRRKQYEYLLKWEGYPHEQNTWEPTENMETCKHLLDAFEKQLARQKELKALRAQQQQQTPAQQQQPAQPQPQQPVQVVKQIAKKADTPALTPTGRPQRTSKARAVDQVKAWCGAEDEPASKKVKRELTSEDDDYSDADARTDKKVNGQTSPGASLDPELVKSLGLGGKGMPNIKGVIKVDPKHMPNLSTGVYIMSKSSGIMKIDSPGKLGPGLNIDQDAIRKQILAAKQKKVEETKKSTPVSQVRKTFGSGGQQVTEKTIITPSGQKIIQRTIQRPLGGDGKSPVNLLTKKLAQGGDSLLRRGGATRGGRGRGFSVSASAGNIVRLREKAMPLIDFEQSDASSDTSDGIEDPFPTQLGPLPPPSPKRELTLCPHTGKRLARAEGEPTPPPTPSPPPTPPPAVPTMLMKVEMSPGGTTGMLIQGDSTQQSLPMLTDEDGTEVKVEAHSMNRMLEDSIGVEEGDTMNLLQAGHPPIMIRGEDGVLYQVAGENEAGQTLLVAAEGMEGAVEGVEGVEGAVDGDGVMYVTREDGQDVLAIDPSQLAQLMPGGEAPALQQVAVQVEGEPGEDATQVIAQLVQADLPSPGGTRRVVLLLPDGSFTMTELDREQYESITEAGKA